MSWHQESCECRCKAAEEEVSRLRGILLKTISTFEDFATSLNFLGHPIAAEAARVAMFATKDELEASLKREEAGKG